jgi:hypothetical protein
VATIDRLVSVGSWVVVLDFDEAGLGADAHGDGVVPVAADISHLGAVAEAGNRFG